MRRLIFLPIILSLALLTTHVQGVESQHQATANSIEEHTEQLKALKTAQEAPKKAVKKKVVKAPPKPQTAVKPAVVASTSCEAYRPLVEKYNWNVETMMRIMKAESGCNPTNHNYTDNHGVCLGSYGLFQIGCVHGHSIAYLEVPENNVAAAYAVWNGGNYAAWSTW